MEGDSHLSDNGIFYLLASVSDGKRFGMVYSIHDTETRWTTESIDDEKCYIELLGKILLPFNWNKAAITEEVFLHSFLYQPTQPVEKKPAYSSSTTVVWRPLGSLTLTAWT